MLMAPEEYKYPELPDGQLELMEPLGWEVERLQETQIAQLLPEISSK